VESLANCFAATQVVHDEGRAIRGLDAIKAWKKDAKAKLPVYSTAFGRCPRPSHRDDASTTQAASSLVAQLRSRTVSSWSMTRLRCWRYGDRDDRSQRLAMQPPNKRLKLAARVGY